MNVPPVHHKLGHSYFCGRALCGRPDAALGCSRGSYAPFANPPMLSARSLADADGGRRWDGVWEVAG